MKKIINLGFFKIVLLFLFIFIAYRLVMDFEEIVVFLLAALSFISNILSYFLCGFGIAYVLNPLVNFFNDKLKFLNRFKYKYGFIVFLVYVIAMGLISLFFVAVVPVTIRSLTELTNNLSSNLPDYINDIGKVYNDLLVKFNIQTQDSNFRAMVADALIGLTRNFSLSWVGNAVSDSINVVLTIIFGFILSIYMLLSKKQMIETTKNIIYGLFPEKKAFNIIELGKRSNKIFSNYLVGKIIDSILNGVFTYIGLKIIGAPYALLISVIIAVTNLVPYFGAFLGVFMAALIVLFSQPNIMLVVWTIAFNILIQQLDNWLIAPKILQNQMGISPILIIAGITIGGSLFGLMGMILGVPVIAVLKEIFYDEYIMKKIKARKVVNNEQVPVNKN